MHKRMRYQRNVTDANPAQVMTSSIHGTFFSHVRFNKQCTYKLHGVINFFKVLPFETNAFPSSTTPGTDRIPIAIFW